MKNKKESGKISKPEINSSHTLHFLIFKTEKESVEKHSRKVLTVENGISNAKIIGLIPSELKNT